MPVVIGSMLAALLQVLDTTIANVALPHMQSALGATTESVTWILTSYIVASAVAMPITGWLAQRFGMRKLFLAAVTGFVLASMACGMAQNLEEMVLFRILQGICGAFILPLSQSAMLNVTPPSQHASTMALWSVGIMIGPILGPVIGGWLTEDYSWRWVFYINVPLGFIGILLLLASLPPDETEKRRFDLSGFALIGLFLASMQLLLDRGQSINWFDAAEAWIYLLVAGISLWLAVFHFLWSDNVLFDKLLFRDRNFLVSFILMGMAGHVLYATLALMPPMLQHLFGYTSIDTGMVLAPRGMGVLISMQISGYLTQRNVDPRLFIAVGMVLSSISLFEMAHWSLAVDSFHIIWTGLLQGLGLGLVFLPVNTIGFATLPPRLRTDAASLLNLARSLGGSVGISLTTVLLARSLQTSHSDLTTHVTSSSVQMIDPATADRFSMLGETVMSIVDAEINRQAMMIGYINVYYTMAWITLGIMPFILLIKRPRTPSAAPSPEDSAIH